MKKKIFISVGILVVIIAIVCLPIFINTSSLNLNPDSIIEPSKETGFISEKIIGNPNGAKVIIYEYADYGCSHCANFNKTINQLMEKHEGKIVLVFRSYVLGIFKNSTQAARAATAAQIQGYFKEYKDLLFDNQAEWLYEKESKLTEVLENYFLIASNNAGDIDKFKEDINSSSVKTRLKFEQNMGKKVDLEGTPTFRIDGKTIDLKQLEKIIEQKITQ